MYFLASSRIRAAEEFDADNDINAIRIARALYDACSDMCEAFELWQATRLIRTRPPPYRGVTLSDLSEAHQRIVIEGEEIIRASHWALARSRRLIEALAKVT
jgi:hypothetical protein